MCTDINILTYPFSVVVFLKSGSLSGEYLTRGYYIKVGSVVGKIRDLLP